MSDRPILVECAACEGAGAIEHHTGRRMDMRAEAIIDEGYVEPCQWCGGTGAELIEAFPVQCSDLTALVPA